jgi:hypothetical protein
VDDGSIARNDREMRNAGAWLMAGLMGMIVTGCASSAPSVQGRRATTQPNGLIGAIPGTMPQRLCTDNIYAGNDAGRVVSTPDDVVIGPVRFSTLRQAAGPNQYSSQTPDGLAYGIKVPATVFGTNSAWVAIRVSDDDNQVKVSYTPGFALTTDPKGESTLMAIQSPIPCGSGPEGFVQYNGGFAWFHAACANLAVYDQAGRLLGSRLIPFGKRSCS